MSHSENVQGRIGIAIMYNATITANPLSYSKICDTFRPRRGQRATRRADLGGKTFVHFLEPCAVPDGFEAEHVAEGRPACIKNRLRHTGLGEPRGIDIADRDIVKIPRDSMRELMQEVAATVGYFSVDIDRLPFLSCPLRHSKFVGQLAKMMGISDLLARGQGGKVFQAKVNTHATKRNTGNRIDHFNADVQKPMTACVAGEACAILDLSFRQWAAVEYAEGIARETERHSFALYLPSLERHPTKGTLVTVAKERSSLLVSRLGVLLAHCIHCARVNSKFLAAANRKHIQVEAGRPFLSVLECEFLGIVAEIPDKVHCFGLSVQQAV